jgi:hypothetical protein
MAFYISRRKALTLIGTFAATSTVLGSISLTNKSRSDAVFAQDKPSSKQRIVYKGHEIIIQESNSNSNDKSVEGDFRLYIRGKRIALAQDRRSGRFMTGYLPFDDFGSLLDMAKEIINLGAVDFDSKK